jgi:hypothetical protein
MSLGDAKWKWPRRIIVAVVGGTVLLIGVVLLFLPGPALVVIPVGLGILGLEFMWARRWIRKLGDKVGVDIEKPVRRVLGESAVPCDDDGSRESTQSR